MFRCFELWQLQVETQQHATFMDESSVKRSSSEMEPPIHEPSTKRTQVMTLEVVQDDFDDATHARMDKAVLEVTQEEEPVPPVLLLATIVSTCNNQLDPKYRENPAAKALLNEHPALVDKLSEAWTARRFRQIRILSSLT
jgi:hypothetical protein